MNVFITDNWNRFLSLFNPMIRDIYFTEEYVKLYENEIDKALCVVCESDGKVTLMPFLRRNIDGYYDFETAYGYGGPIFNDTSDGWINESLGAINDCFVRNGYICGFVRFHPLLGNAGLCREHIDVVYDRKTIFVDTRASLDDIWSSQITSKNRNMIRKAEKNGLEFRVDDSFTSMSSFKLLYEKTMKRLEVGEFFFFRDSYYKEFMDAFGNNGFIGVVSRDERIIGAALFMFQGPYGHYHLAGSDTNYSSFGINNFLLWNTIKIMKELGVSSFHLGGGTDGMPDNSLYRFKKSFSNHENDFYIGKWIFNHEIYEKKCLDWETKNPDMVPIYGNRLLKYRYSKETV